MKSYAGNPNSLADSILEALYNDGLCRTMAKNAREKVMREFNWNTISKNTMNVYKLAVKANKAVKPVTNLEKLAEKETQGTATMVDGKDTTITTYTTDREINILQNPLKKKIRAT